MINKLYFILFFSIFCFFVNTNAQEIRFGIQAGAGLASAINYFPKKNDYTNDPDFLAKNSPVLSYSANLYISYPLDENYRIAVEPGFIQKGFAVQFVEKNDQTYNRTFLSYIQLPVLLEMQFSEPITLTFGPEVAYLLNAKLKEKDMKESDSLMHYYRKNRVDFGLQAGAFYTFSGNIDVGLKAGGSITNLEKLYIEIEGGSAFVEAKKKAMYLNIFTRYKF